MVVRHHDSQPLAVSSALESEALCTHWLHDDCFGSGSGSDTDTMSLAVLHIYCLEEHFAAIPPFRASHWSMTPYDGSFRRAAT